MYDVNEVYMISFALNRLNHESAVTILKPHNNGKIEAVKVIYGQEAEALYDLIMGN